MPPTCLLAVLLAAGPAAPPSDDITDLPMYADPPLPTPRVVTRFSPRLVELWRTVLDRPEADAKVRVAQDVVLAQSRGMPGLDTLAGPLARELERPGQHPTAVLAVARALVAIDARSAADALHRTAAAGGHDLKEVIEPALARWDHPAARADWLARVRTPATPQRLLTLAARGLGAVREPAAAGPLRELVFSADAAPPVRLEAAAALGLIRTAGGEADARTLAADPSPRGLTGRLAAVSLLRRHTGAAAVEVLQSLARDATPPVATAALARLVEIDPVLARPALDPAMASPDAGVRAVAVDAMLRLADPADVERLSARLADPHPEVRRQARRALEAVAGKPGGREPGLRAADRAIASPDWRAAEQGAVLAARVGYKPAADRLLPLLPHARPEVAVAAAWGLRELAVPETLPAALDYLRTRRTRPPTAGSDHQLAHLLQLMGRTKYAPASAAVTAFVPPGGWTGGVEARAAGAWAAGRIHEGKPDPAVTWVLVGRVTAVMPPDMEQPPVRRMAAIGLGWMRAEAALPALKRFCPEVKANSDAASTACGWAISRITGSPLGPPDDEVKTPLGWHYTPID